MVASQKAKTGRIGHPLGGKKEVDQYRTGNSSRFLRHRVLRSLPKVSLLCQVVRYQGDGKTLVRTLCVTVETPVKSKVKSSFHTALRGASRDRADCVSRPRRLENRRIGSGEAADKVKSRQSGLMTSTDMCVLAV